MNNRIRIVKVKYKDQKVAIEYQKFVRIGVWDDFSMSCSSEPAPEFHKAFKELKKHLIDMCEFTYDVAERITVTGVSFSYAGEHETMGATLIGKYQLLYSNAPLNLVTPHKASEPYAGPDAKADEKQILDGECVEALVALQDEAVKYVQGERAQLKLAV